MVLVSLDRVAKNSKQNNSAISTFHDVGFTLEHSLSVIHNFSVPISTGSNRILGAMIVLIDKIEGHEVAKAIKINLLTDFSNDRMKLEIAGRLDDTVSNGKQIVISDLIRKTKQQMQRKSSLAARNIEIRDLVMAAGSATESHLKVLLKEHYKHLRKDESELKR